ncbi:ADP-ribosylglycohydrolase family protein [Paenibacillus vulneris]|uniref:ADP-ribosylglycohydrolase family protein n=1 Tax=Paenibacillus vulneris TaxID=1133364 RepID=A0ABW3ULU2_9BACL
MAPNYTALQRITACFKGIATGDAIGKQTESLQYEEIREWFPNGINGFEGEVGMVMPRYKGKHYDYRFGETTDDTEQTLAIAKVIVEGLPITHTAVGKQLMLCKKSNRLTLALGRFQEQGDPSRVTFEGNGCGAAMRVAPIGALYSSAKIQDLLSSVFEASIPTHGGRIAISGASAVAAAVSAAIDNKSPEEVLQHSVLAARNSEKYRPEGSEDPICIADLILQIFDDLASEKDTSLDRIKEKYMPWKTPYIVALAINFAVLTKSADKTILLASNLGGDTDSVASMGAGIAAAMFPETLNNSWYTSIEKVNGGELVALAPIIAALRT